MKQTTRTITFVGLAGLATLLTVALALGATARPGGGEGGPGRMLDRLDLSDESRAQLEAAMERAHEEARPLREALEEERRALETILREDEADVAAALDQVERVGQAQTALYKLRVAAGIELRGLLTQEEREAWDEAREARKEHRKRRFERFRGGHGERRGMDHGFDEPGGW